MPISPLESARAALDWPLAFYRGDNGLQLVAVLSLDDTDNYAVGPKGLWMGGYMPAIVRAHPLSMSVRDGKAAVLVDTQSDWLSTDKGNPMFDSEGNPNQVVNRRIGLLKNQGPNPRWDNPALEAVHKSGILEPWNNVFENLYKVNQQKLVALEEQSFLELRRNRVLAPIYAQLMSMPRINRLRNLAQRKQKMKERLGLNLNLEQDNDISLTLEDDDIIRFDDLD